MSRQYRVWKTLNEIAVVLISQGWWLPCSPVCLEYVNWIIEAEDIAISCCEYSKIVKRLTCSTFFSYYQIIFVSQHK